MMKIIVLSDTHSRMIPQQVLDALSSVDLIIHAGDMCDETALKNLQNLCDIKAVCGNMDSAGLRKKLPGQMILKCEDVRIGVVHGKGRAEQILAYVQDTFIGEDVDVVVFGHSHEPFNQKIGGVLYFNPGSPNDEIFSPYCSYGILEIDGKHISSKIIKVE